MQQKQLPPLDEADHGPDANEGGSRLPAYPHTDRSERAVKANVFSLRRIDTAVHRAKEEIGAIACADFEILDVEG